MALVSIGYKGNVEFDRQRQHLLEDFNISIRNNIKCFLDYRDMVQEAKVTHKKRFETAKKAKNIKNEKIGGGREKNPN